MGIIYVMSDIITVGNVIIVGDLMKTVQNGRADLIVASRPSS